MQVRHILMRRAGRHHFLSLNLIRFTPNNSDLTELKNPTPNISYSATTDMTGVQVLAWLRANVDFRKLNVRSKIRISSSTYSIWTNDGLSFSAYGVATHPTYGTISIAFLTAYSGSAFDRWSVGSTNVLTSIQLYTGNRIEIFY